MLFGAVCLFRLIHTRRVILAVARGRAAGRKLNFTTITRRVTNMFNISTRKVGGLRFVKLGRFTFMFCVSKEYKPL